MSEARAPAGAAAVAAPDADRALAAWLTSALLVVVVLGTAGLYWPSTQSLLHEWLEVPTSVYGHGPLLVIVALALIVRAVQAARLAPAPEWDARWWVVLALASVAWLVALRTGIQVAHQLMVPVLIWLAIRTLMGPRIAALSLVPIGLIYSAIPVWHVAIPVLQDLTVLVVRTLLRVVGIAAYAEGDFIYIRGAVFHVEDGCAGLRYFTVGVAVAAVVGALRGDGWRSYFKLIALAVSLTILANWLRVFIVIVAGHLTNMQHYLVRVEHVKFGWLVFALAMLIFLMVVRRWPAAREARPELPPSVARVAPGGVLLALAALVSGPAWSWLAPVRPAVAVNVSLPETVNGWQAVAEGCRESWQPSFASADRESLREFTGEGGSVCAYVASYLVQRQDKELIGYGSQVYGSAQVRAVDALEIVGRGVNEMRIAAVAGPERIVWYTYAVGSREMRRGIEAQLRYAVGTLHGSPAASVMALSAVCLPDCDAARERLSRFLPNIQVGDVDD